MILKSKYMFYCVSKVLAKLLEMPSVKVLVKARSLHQSGVISYGVGAYSSVESFVVERCCSVFGC